MCGFVGAWARESPCLLTGCPCAPQLWRALSAYSISDFNSVIYTPGHVLGPHFVPAFSALPLSITHSYLSVHVTKCRVEFLTFFGRTTECDLGSFTLHKHQTVHPGPRRPGVAVPRISICGVGKVTYKRLSTCFNAAYHLPSAPLPGIVLFTPQYSSPLIRWYTDMSWSEGITEQFALVDRFTTEEND